MFQLFKTSNIKELANQSKMEKQAIALIDQAKPEELEMIYRRLIKQGTDDHIVYGNLGAILLKQSRHEESIPLLQKALEINPNYSDAHSNLGVARRKQGNLDGAISSYNNALRLKPNHHNTHYNLGIALQEKGDLTAAIKSYKYSLRLKPNYAVAHYNLGNALHEKGDLQAAIDSYNNAIKIKPDYQEAHWNSSLTMLLKGDYKDGWEKYEWRIKKEKEPIKIHACPNCDLWNGKDTLSKTKQLLLVAEQGLGDTLQFMRYVDTIRNKENTVKLCAQSKLHSLIQTSGIDPSPLTPEQANQVSAGHWIPLLSVPKHLKISPNNPIVTEPYIKTTKKLIARWANILREEKQPIIGINWQGNPKTEKGGLQGRSIALEAFAPVANTGLISLLSLQKGFGSEQMKTCSFKDRFISCQDQINETWDFLETAAIIENCDLVITSDTSVAHLAGGMGKPTWLLLHNIPDWRWGFHGDSTFWYPSMRLFRQKERGNWNEVIEQVAGALNERFGGR